MMKGDAGDAIAYAMEANTTSVRIATPFNIQKLLSERTGEYKRTADATVVEKITIPDEVGFPKYSGKVAALQRILVGVTIVDYDCVFAMNVALVAGHTRYLSKDGTGQVLAVGQAREMYKGSPYFGTAIAASFPKGFGGQMNMQGVEWAHFLYHRLYPERVKFCETVAVRMRIDPDVCNATRKVNGEVKPAPLRWTKTFDPANWSMFVINNSVLYLTVLRKLQDYRGKDTNGISAMTYAAYGEEFNSDYRLAEKISNFKLFLSNIDDDMRKRYPVYYITDSERELICAMKLALNMDFTFVHYHSQPIVIDGTKYDPAKSGRFTFTGKLVYDGRCVTSPFSAKLERIDVDNYIDKNRCVIQDVEAKFSASPCFAIRAHVLGVEEHIIGMACPHNGVGVFMRGKGRFSQTEVWRLVSMAGHVRNTYLFHRRSLSNYLETHDRVMLEKELSKRKGIMEWVPLQRPLYHPFTKEQRKRVEDILKTFNVFTADMANMSELDLLDHVQIASRDPKKADALARAMVDDKIRQQDPFTVSVPVNAVVPVRGVKIGQDLEADTEDVLETEDNIFQDEVQLEGRALRREQMAGTLSASGQKLLHCFVFNGLFFFLCVYF